MDFSLVDSVEVFSEFIIVRFSEGIRVYTHSGRKLKVLETYGDLAIVETEIKRVDNKDYIHVALVNYAVSMVLINEARWITTS